MVGPRGPGGGRGRGGGQGEAGTGGGGPGSGGTRAPRPRRAGGPGSAGSSAPWRLRGAGRGQRRGRAGLAGSAARADGADARRLPPPDSAARAPAGGLGRTGGTGREGENESSNASVAPLKVPLVAGPGRNWPLGTRSHQGWRWHLRLVPSLHRRGMTTHRLPLLHFPLPQKEKKHMNY
ncbi:uncharacterized protein GJ701_005731 [Geothlypis trichas]